MSDVVVSEVIKAIASFAGTIVIAGITALIAVYFALKRFKAERLWERRLSIYADLIDALSEKERILGVWLRGIENGTTYGASYTQELSDRFSRARLKFENAAAASRLLLGPDADEIIKNYEAELEKSDSSTRSQYDAYDMDAVAASKAIESLLRTSKQHLQISQIDFARRRGASR